MTCAHTRPTRCAKAHPMALRARKPARTPLPCPRLLEKTRIGCALTHRPRMAEAASGGRFCDSGKMANATPTPALPRCGRWRVLQGRGRIDCGIGNGCLLFRRTAPSLAGRSPQRAGSHAKCVHILRGARGRVGMGVRHVCSINLSPIHAPICPLPLWGRDGVGFGDAASVFFRPSVCQNHHHRYRACFFTHLQGISAMFPVADDEPTPHPATINPTPALRRVPRKMRPHFSWVPAHRGRVPIGGKTSDRSCIPSLSGRSCDCGKMANATPTPIPTE